ncbi:hypothetical protein tb265_20940 [Gemmatimonadetes bacterium T265]|nr:hypothetical protein tb265_20940 [Gemmatimonadetes bacterium T265]
MSLLDLVQQQLGAGGTEQIASQIGADPSTTQNAIQAAIPMILGGMAGNARDPQGASAISNALGQSGGLGGLAGMLGGGGGGLGGMLGGLLGGGGGGGAGIGGMLGGLLGQHEDTVQTGVQQASGLSGDQTKKLLMILAPIALAALAHQRSQAQQSPTGAVAGAESGGGADLDGNGIPDVLEQQAREAQAQSNSHVGGLIGKILDLGARPAR